MAAPPLGKWKEYADDAWFRAHETVCETTLADFFAAGPAAGPAHTAPPVERGRARPLGQRHPGGLVIRHEAGHRVTSNLAASCR